MRRQNQQHGNGEFIHPSLSSHYLPPRVVGRRERGGSVVWLTNEICKLFPCDSATGCDWSSATPYSTAAGVCTLLQDGLFFGRIARKM
jgi:hypothetical protein